MCRSEGPRVYMSILLERHSAPSSVRVLVPKNPPALADSFIMRSASLQDSHSQQALDRVRSLTYCQDECSYRHAEEEE